MSAAVFVTGASGFVGARLAHKLAQRGLEVRCLVRDPDRAPSLRVDDVRLVHGDITDKESMRQAMKGVEAVFHVAGWYELGVRDVRRMHAINVDGARNTLELAAELGVPKILHTSSVAVFGNTHGKMVDETYRAPKEALQKRGAPVIIVQPGLITGPGDRSPHIQVLNMFLGRWPVMLGARSGMTLAHVDDIAEGHVLAMQTGRAGETYVLAGEAITYKQLFEMCEQLTGIPAAKLWLPGWAAGALSAPVRLLEAVGIQGAFPSEGLAALNDYTYWATAQKAQQQLGWKRRPLDETLREVLAYLRGGEVGEARL
jgi:nucleoside-diphosphate-sugar epimerase